jgi:hypothetical protein
MKYEKKITENLIEKILSKGVRDMPQNPASRGFTPEQIREFYYLPEQETLELLMDIEDEMSNVVNDVADLFKLVEVLPQASKDTLGKIYLVPQAKSQDKNEYIEYLTVKNGDDYAWENIGSTTVSIAYDDKLDEFSENAVQNKVIAALVKKINNISNGEGEYSLQMNNWDNPNYAYGKASMAAGFRNKTYQNAAFAFGGGHQTGMTEEEFNAYFRDDVNQVPLDGGKGKNADGKILNNAGENGQTYADSLCGAFTCGVNNYNITRGSLVGGEANYNTGEHSLLMGYGLKNEGEKSYLFGGEYGYSGKDKPSITNKGKYNFFAGFNLRSGNGSTHYNNVVLLGTGLTATNDNQVIVGKNSKTANLGPGSGLRFAVGVENYGLNALEIYHNGSVRVYKAPTAGSEVARKQEIDDLKTYVDNAVANAGGGANVDLSEYVKNTDYATTTKARVIRTNESFCTTVNTSGALNGQTITLAQYTNRTPAMFISKGTLENIKTDLVSRSAYKYTLTFTNSTGTLDIYSMLSTTDIHIIKHPNEVDNVAQFPSGFVDTISRCVWHGEQGDSTALVLIGTMAGNPNVLKQIIFGEYVSFNSGQNTLLIPCINNIILPE